MPKLKPTDKLKPDVLLNQAVDELVIAKGRAVDRKCRIYKGTLEQADAVLEFAYQKIEELPP